MLALSRVVLITYGMEILNGASTFGYSIIGELLFLISILFLMEVAMTRVGIHLMERRHL